jgi:TatA/E family protein of Tat protein translocase
MEFFGIGGPEFLVVLVIAILLFGPDKIPSMAAQVGKTIRDFRRYTSDLTKEFDAATGDLRSEFQNIAGDLRGELEATQADLRSQLDLTDVFRDTPKEVVSASVAAIPGAETQALPVAAESNGIAAEPEPAPTITVTTPYADAIAANGASAAETMPVGTASMAVATKADPFADLATLVVDRREPEPVTVYESVSVASFAADPAQLAEPPVLATNGNGSVNGNGKPKIGGSVAGSKYSRRKSG